MRMAGHCGMLRDVIEQQPDEEARHRMERIEASVRRMNDVIDGMLGLAQLTKIELVRRPIDLNAVAAEVVQELQHAISRPPRALSTSTAARRFAPTRA